MLTQLKKKTLNVPGKVLFFGGYSVLELGHISLSLAVVDHTGNGVTATVEDADSDALIARQFGIEQMIDSPELIRKNIAVSTFFLTRLYLKSKGHSTSHTVSLTNSPIFGIEHKSGLGSSAAATVAVVKSLFHAYCMDNAEHSEIIHKLSQYCGAAFTNKIGSGFDIATCAAGHTIIYKRFNPSSIILPLDFKNATETTSKILSSIEKPWPDLQTQLVSMPSKYGLLFFNIEGGKTSTVSNVRTVSEWKSQHPSEYRELMEKQNSSETDAIGRVLKGDNDGLRRCTHSAREIHRRLQGLVAKSYADLDPIEPEPLTKLIEFAEKIHGIVAGRCPGAGGWDGLAFIIDRDRFHEGSINAIIAKANEYELVLRHLPLQLL